MDKPSFSGSFWLRYLSIVANRLKRWSLVCAWCICLQWSLYPPFKEQFPPVWTHFKERLWIVSILALIKLSPNAGTSPEDLGKQENGTYRFRNLDKHGHVNLILHAPKLLAEDRSPHVEMQRSPSRNGGKEKCKNHVITIFLTFAESSVTFCFKGKSASAPS